MLWLSAGLVASEAGKKASSKERHDGIRSGEVCSGLECLSQTLTEFLEETNLRIISGKYFSALQCLWPRTDSRNWQRCKSDIPDPASCRAQRFNLSLEITEPNCPGLISQKKHVGQKKIGSKTNPPQVLALGWRQRQSLRSMQGAEDEMSVLLGITSTLWATSPTNHNFVTAWD